MKAGPVVLASFLLFAGIAAEGGYRDLSRELDGYRPPAWLTEAAPPSRPSAAGADDFEIQAAKLRSLAAGWAEALASPPPEESFLVPDPALLDRMKGIAGDDNAVRDALSGRFTLEELETLALLRNPAAAAKERELLAVLEGYGQVESLDTVLRRYSSFTASLMTGVGPMESSEAMEASRFPYPGILALKGQVVSQDARAAREELEKARRSAVTAVRKAHWEILYLRDARRTIEEVHQLLEQFKSTAAGRYSAGEASYQDVVKVAIELEKVKEEHLSLDGELLNAESMVREALALPPSAEFGFPADARRGGDLPDLAALQATARERRQEIRAAKAMIGKMERMVEMQETMVLPPLTLNLSRNGRDEITRVGAGGMGAGEGSFPTSTTASTGGGLPKNPFFAMQEGYVRELRKRVEALSQELRMEEAASDLAVRTAWFGLEKARREEALYADRVVTLSRSALESSNRGYSAGKVAFADVIESYRTWLEANLSRSRGRSDVGTAWAELEAAVGTSLPAAAGPGGGAVEPGFKGYGGGGR
jgi:outer membrane protein TolC